MRRWPADAWDSIKADNAARTARRPLRIRKERPIIDDAAPAAEVCALPCAGTSKASRQSLAVSGFGYPLGFGPSHTMEDEYPGSEFGRAFRRCFAHPCEVDRK